MNVDPASSPGLIEIQEEIRADFGWGLDADLASAKNLRDACDEKSRMLDSWTERGRQETFFRLQERLITGPVTVLGAAAEPDDVRTAIQDGHQLIAADGAVGVLTEVEFSEIAWNSLVCIVSDADGEINHLTLAAERKVPFILHGHGDNTDEWDALLDILHLNGTPLILTHQTPEGLRGMHNPGGFTDGDRAVCLALSMNVRPNQIKLGGFRTDLIGRWTGATHPERKMRKLDWMRRVLEVAGVGM